MNKGNKMKQSKDDESLKQLRARPNFVSREYPYRVFLPFKEIKKGMMVLEEDDCDKENSVPFMCEVVETGMDQWDFGGGVERPCYALRIVAYSETGTVIYDWRIRSMVPGESEEGPERDVFFRTAEEAARFGIEPSKLQDLGVWPPASKA